MKSHLSLPTRIFLFAFVSVCLVTGAGFGTLNEAIKGKIKDRLKESFQASEQVLDYTATRYRNRSTQLLVVLSENAGLKAAMGLLSEIPAHPRAAAQVRKTIEANLFEIGRGLDYQLMLVTDSSGKPLAGTVNLAWGTTPLDPLPSSVEPSPLIEVQGILYEATTVPINLGTENLGSLTLAREFDIASWSPSGHTALISEGTVLRTTFPEPLRDELESQLQSKCLHAEEGCEIRVEGETFLALPLHRVDWEGHYQLLSFQSLDAALEEFTQGFVGLFLWIGALGTMGAMLLALVGARTISQPITDLIHCLKESQESGRLRTDFPADSAVEEVNLLAAALNQAAQAVQDSQERLEQASLEFLETMARALDARDPYTAGHSDRVSANATAIAEAMGLPPDQIEIIRIGAKMHDIGKIGIPDAVLQKPGPLTEEEFDLIKLHPQMGKRILEKVGQFQDYLPIIELHHEDWDGRGYPYGLVGEEAPLGARIVHVADVHDAITSNRAYRSAMPPEQVMEIMQRGSGTQFEPGVTEVFLSLLRQRHLLEEILNEVNSASDSKLCYDEIPSQFS